MGYKLGMSLSSILVRRLGSADLPLMLKLNTLFADAFDDPDTYTSEVPSHCYLEGLLAKEHVIALVALADQNVLGGLVAYELDKFERMRREFYIYDLAVAQDQRKRGVATALIEQLREIALQRGAWVVFVQADYGDDAAIGLYEKLGVREEVLHFDIGIEVE